MSLILEALRKSEAERRRGEAPGLRVELPPLAPPARRGMPAWGWLALAGMAVTVVLVVVLLRGVNRAGADRMTDAGAASSSTREHDATGDAPRNPRGATANGLPHVERIVAPASDPATTQSQAAVDAPPAGSTADVSGAIPTTTSPSASAQRAPTAPVPATPEPLPPSTAARPSDATETARTAPAMPPAPRPAPAAVIPAPATDLPRVTELPASQRQRLPTLKMTMHMWNADPGRRFVIVDGRRLVEGDRVGEATVRTIDADGVVLELEGQSLRLPLR